MKYSATRRAPHMSTLARTSFRARMILLIINCLLAAALSLGSEVAPQAPARQSYPAIIRDSVDRRSRAEREWRRMLDAYGVVQTPPDLYPITDTPRSLVGVSEGIRILDYKPDPGDEAFALRQAVKVFIDRWRDLLAIDPAAVSLVSADESGDARRLTFRQISYAHPVAGSFGVLVIIINRNGTIVQLDDRFVPVVELPVKPSLEREVAVKKVAGRSFSYTDIAGRQQQAHVEPGEVTARRLVVLPIEKGDAVEVHLAWEIIAGKSLSWTVYIDAVNGEELRVDQNFQT